MKIFDTNFNEFKFKMTSSTVVVYCTDQLKPSPMQCFKTPLKCFKTPLSNRFKTPLKAWKRIAAATVHCNADLPLPSVSVASITLQYVHCAVLDPHHTTVGDSCCHSNAHVSQILMTSRDVSFIWLIMVISFFGWSWWYHLPRLLGVFNVSLLLKWYIGEFRGCIRTDF